MELKCGNINKIKLYLLISVLVLISIEMNAGIKYDSNHLYAYGQGMVKYDISDRQLVSEAIMLQGCNVKDVIIEGRKMLVLTEGVYNPENDFVNDNRPRLLFTDDGGENFKDVTPKVFFINHNVNSEISSMGRSKDNPEHIVANISSLSDGNWYYESFDFGLSWKFMFDGEAAAPQGITVLNSSDGFWAYGSGVNMTGEIINYNPINKWRLLDTELPEVRGLVVNPTNESNIVYYSSETINVSSDNGITWDRSLSSIENSNINARSEEVNAIKFYSETNGFIALIAGKRSELFPSAPLFWTFLRSEDGGRSWDDLISGVYEGAGKFENIDFCMVEGRLYISEGEEIIIVAECNNVDSVKDLINSDEKGGNRYQLNGLRYQGRDKGLYIENGRVWIQ